MNIIQYLVSTGWPIDFHLSLLRSAQAEVKSLVAGGKITPGRSRESRLPVHLDPGSEPIPVAASTAQREHQQTQLPASIQKPLRMAAQSRHHDILPPIIVQITERGPAP